MTSKRQLKGKIRTVRDIRQITKAMEMVAATKMRRAQESAFQARPYAKKSVALLSHVLEYAKREEISNIFFQSVLSDTVCLVVVTSDKGLAGSFNSAVLRLANEWREAMENDGKTVEVVAVGKKGRDFFKKRGVPIAGEFFQYSDIFTLSDIEPLMDWILAAYAQRRYGEIVFCSTQFISALSQKPEIRHILPLDKNELEKIVEGIVPKTGRYAQMVKEEQLPTGNQPFLYLFEPSVKAILQELVGNLIRVMILHLMFESNASEHSARMVAMKNATENAERLMESLNLELQKARQAAITQELAEVTTAKEALTAE